MIAVVKAWAKFSDLSSTAMSSSRQLELAIEAEQEALWWAHTATSNSSLLLYIIQTLPNRIRDSVLVPGQSLFPHSSNEGQNPLRWAREECAFNQAALEKLRDERAEHLGALALQLQTDALTESVAISNHRRPSHITILWPKILLKTLVIYSSFSALKYGYDQRFIIREWISEGREAVKGLVQGWVVEPVLDVWNTVRASDIAREGLVHRQGVLADIESLERMALSLAKDVLRYDDARLQILKEQVHQGDLTPLMQLYESDIRSPVKSALAGTLVRGILVQVQKAKVDIDQALTGIDKLLKSQELTFAFVGVAPALVILYVLSQAGLSLGRAALFASKNALLGAGRGIKEAGDLISRILRVIGIRPFVCDDKEALNLAEAPNGGGVGDTIAAIFGEQIPGPQTTIHGWIGKVSKRQAWADLRRVERLLIHRGVQAPNQPDEKTLEGQIRGGDALGPLATGLLLLSVVRLQAYGMSLPSSTSTTSSFSIPTAYPTSSGYLPHAVGLLNIKVTSPTFGAAASSLTSASTPKYSATHAGLLTLDTRTSFLEDVKDLGDLKLGREDKLRVVQRMWRWWDFGLDGGL